MLSQKPSRNVLITNSSASPATRAPDRNTVHVFPQGLYIPSVINTPENHELFVKQFLMSRRERQAVNEREALVAKNMDFYEKANALDESETIRKKHIPYRISDVPTILICSHNSRDRRCGILGPLLHETFEEYITSQLYKNTKEWTSEGRIKFNLKEDKTFDIDPAYRGIKVASVSHVGGHVWAGNVIIYIPSNYRLVDGEESPLAGKGVWYGRVEPKHVEGIVEETIKKGRVIEELLRGVHPNSQKVYTARTDRM